MRATRMQTHATATIIVFAALFVSTAFAFAGPVKRPEAAPILSGSNIDLVDLVEVGGARAAIASDPYVYAVYGRALVVLDVSNPGNPVRVGIGIVPPACDDMEILGDYLYCYCQTLVQVVDVSEPSSPKLEGSFEAVGSLLDIDNDRLYIKNSLASSGLQVYDLADPTAPALLGTSVSPLGEEFAVQDGYVVSSYGSSNGGVKIFDATNPTSPVLAGSLAMVEGAQDVDVTWPYAYAVNHAPASSRGLYVIDISNPALPSQVAFQASGPFPVDDFEEIVINGNHAYVGGGTAPLGVFDISTPAAPVRLPSVVVCEGSFDQRIEVSGRLAVMGSLCVMDCSNPSFPIPLANYEAVPGGNDLALAPTHFVLPLGGAGLALVNRDDTQDRSFFQDDPDAYNSVDVAVRDDYAYITSSSFVFGFGLVIVFDISDPASPTPVGDVGILGFLEQITLGLNHAYVSSFNRLISIDISDPTAPVVAGEITINPVFYDFAVAEPYLYVATYNDGLKIFDVSNPAAPTPVGAGIPEVAFSGEPIRIAVSGGHAFVVVTGPNVGVRVVDVTNPLLPAIVGNFAFAPSTTGYSEVTARDSFFYFSANGILRAIDASDPTNPIEGGNILLGDVSGINVDPPFIYLLGLGGHILTLETDFVATDVGAGARSPFVLGQNHPNPFNPSTSISFQLPSPSRALLEIFDVRGSLVRTLADETMSAGPHQVEWNGRDDGGGIVGSGVYFYRLTAGGHSQAKKMVILK